MNAEKTAVAIRNGHVPAAASVAMHMAALAELRTLAEKIIYACEHSDGQTTTGTIRRWLAGHGVPTRDSQRPYISAAVNNWRRDHDLAAQRKRPSRGKVVDLIAGKPIEAERVEPTALEPAADDRPVTVPDRPQDDVSLPSGRPPDASTVPQATPVRAGAAGFYVVAAMSMTVSVDTSWRFFGTELGITNLGERTAMFAVLEAALLACGYGMRAGVRHSGRPGAARFWVWALCGLAAYMALVLSGPVAGLARVALGPALGVVMLHLALGIEIRAGAHRVSPWARVGRELRERLLSRFGLADDERDALARTRDRAARRVARLSLGGFVLWRSSRLARALRASNVAHDEAARARMLAELSARRHADELSTLHQPSPWTNQS